ncbi:MAG: exodeoxyribonuclease VII large subunit [Candidatus Thioglobus sp.]|nr:exodeoxyribonuclease VII large subunit [Candidatus Thioglobus sp.]
MQTEFNIDQIYTVSDFLSLCNKSIENSIPTCWLRGEMSNLSRPTSGHWYFSLKDNNGQIRCVIFRLNQRKIRFNPENGMEILLRAAPTLYEDRGDFQLIVQHLEAVGTGDLQLAFEQLKTKLKNEGLFDNIHKKPLPKIVKTIGVISSKNGAVIRDIIKILNKRYPFAKILLFDSVVQGEGSELKIAQALQAADQSGRCDVLIIARGGGSLEDLWAFNTEVLSRAIFAAKTPVVSAIGHETDITIADFISDASAPTPSAAAILVTPDRLEMLSNLHKRRSDLWQLFQQILQNYHQQLKQLSLSTPNLKHKINSFAQKLDSLNLQILRQISSKNRLSRSRLATLFERLKRNSPSANIRHKQQQNQYYKVQLKSNIFALMRQNNLTLNRLQSQLQSEILQDIQRQKNQLASHAQALNLLSPLSILSRGYSITSSENNQLLQSADGVKIGDLITTVVSDGKIYSNVKKIQKT